MAQSLSERPSNDWSDLRPKTGVAAYAQLCIDDQNPVAGGLRVLG